QVSPDRQPVGAASNDDEVKFLGHLPSLSFVEYHAPCQISPRAMLLRFRHAAFPLFMSMKKILGQPP
ncbi:MAG: hypothetical protein JW753_00880, partial [Dehalococcoidia bacterium]|nr:hypothetical protein [Dehalococcoidia bacterium]